MSLKVKFLIFVVFMLFIELVPVAGLAYLQTEAETQALRARKAAAVTNAVNVISEQVYQFMTTLQGSKLDKNFVMSKDLTAVKVAGNEQYALLTEALKGDAQKWQVVANSRAAYNEALDIFQFLQKNIDAQEELGDSGGRKKYLRRLRVVAQNVLSPDLLEINREGKDISRRSPEEESRIRTMQKSLLLFAVAINVALAIAAALYLVRGISARLQTVIENTSRFARRETLLPPLKGTDEISRLDHQFHRVSAALTETSERERAVVENARDLICSIDPQGRFLAVNSACQRILGYSVEQLVGRYYIDTVVSEDTAHVLAKMEDATKTMVAPFEVRMKRHDNSNVDTLWTVSYSASQKSTFCVIHDDSDRKEAQRMREEVLNMLTHDLKTPLSTINNFHEMLGAEMLGELNPRGREILRIAERNSARMMGLINDMLDIEKIKSGMMVLEVAPVELHLVLESAAASLRGLADSAGVLIEVVPTDIVINADENRLARVVTNLLSNAIKFSSRGKSIKITSTRVGEVARIDVADQGRGIPAKVLPTIFDPYTQSDAGDAVKKGGTGLGLTICKALVELHGGEISVHSVEGEGTTFSFTIPCA